MTYASSRKDIFHQNLISVSEIYLCLRYFGKSALQEAIFLSLLGTFRNKQTILHQFSKVVIGIVRLPYNLLTVNRRVSQS